MHSFRDRPTAPTSLAIAATLSRCDSKYTGTIAHVLRNEAAEAPQGLLSARIDPEDLREAISAYQQCVAERPRLGSDGSGVALVAPVSVMIAASIFRLASGIPMSFKSWSVRGGSTETSISCSAKV